MLNKFAIDRARFVKRPIVEVADLYSEFFDKTSEELKKAKRESNGQLPLPVQRELSLRDSFIEFHRFCFSLREEEVLAIWRGLKQFSIDEKLSEDESVYCDHLLLRDALQYQIALRQRVFHPEICDEIADSFRTTEELSKNYKITSNILIEFAQKLNVYRPGRGGIRGGKKPRLANDQKKVSMTIRVPPLLKSKVSEISKEEGISCSLFIERAIEKEINKKEKPPLSE